MFRRWTLGLWNGCVLAIYIILLIRLFMIQVVHNHSYSKIAENQARTKITLSPERGVIYDRNFRMLAFDINQFSFGVDPTQLNDKRQIAQTFARITGNKEGYFQDLLKGKHFVWLARAVDQKTSESLTFDRSNPVAKIRESGRYYPYQRAGAHLIGFTNIDNIGLAGIEKAYDDLLEGELGFKVMMIDAERRFVPVIGEPEQAPVDGQSIVLTLNMDYQLIVEEELKKGIEHFNAKGGMAVILDPNTSEVLALVSFPSFNPNHFESYSSAEQRNRVLVDPFEPGSTFKLVTAAAALQEGVVQPTDWIYCENGKKTFPGGAITDYKKLGMLTFKEVFVHSSNIGFAKISQKVGKKKIYQYGRAFGFGAPTGLEQLGEDRGKFTNAAMWRESDAVRISIGYGVLTTALQITNAYAAVANGGYLLKTRILKAVLSGDNQNLIQETKPDTIRQVLLPATIAQLKSFLLEAVENGTGKSAKIEGITIGGKTGTTKKYDPILRSYSSSKYVASFVGFTPVDHPKLVCLVVVDEPAYPNYYGGLVAAPIFQNIIKRVLGAVAEPIEQADSLTVIAQTVRRIRLPDVTELNISHAKAILEDYQFQIRIEGNGGFVMAQQPAAGVLLSAGEIVKLILGESTSTESNKETVPDVVGMSIRDAIHILTQAGFDPIPEGSGFVVSQDPEPNSRPNLRKCRIICRPMSS